MRILARFGCGLGWLMACGLAGCLHHEARIDQPAEHPGPEGWHGETWIGGAVAAVPAGVSVTSASTVKRSPLPRDIAVSAWRIENADAGTVHRQEAVIRTPLPWWQGFPFDLPVDLWPGDVVIRQSLVIAPAPVMARTAERLDHEAAADGYGRGESVRPP